MDAILNETEDHIVATGRLKDLFQSVKFPAAGPSQEWREENHCYQIKTKENNYNPETHKVVKVAPFIFGPGDVRSVEIVALTPEEIAAAFDIKKQNKLSELSREFSVRRKSGVTVSGNLFATTNDGHQELKALKERLDRVGGTQKAVTRAGDFIEADATQATAIFTAVDDYIAACWSREYDLRVAINAATNATELEAIDITSGWPVSEQPQ